MDVVGLTDVLDALPKRLDPCATGAEPNKPEDVVVAEPNRLAPC